MKSWPFHITLLVAILGFAYGALTMISPDIYKSMNPPALGYVFVPDKDAFVGDHDRLEISFMKFGSEAPFQVTAHISRNVTDPPQDLYFQPLFYQGIQTDSWYAILPGPQRKRRPVVLLHNDRHNRGPTDRALEKHGLVRASLLRLQER